tara:strand:- start:756 stop:905 length:150 start_codon:yes stop_codon:yes gene_type:complete
MADIVWSVVMSDFLSALLICGAFVAGFWTGVDWYKRQIMEEDAKAPRTE